MKKLFKIIILCVFSIPGISLSAQEPTDSNEELAQKVTKLQEEIDSLRAQIFKIDKFVSGGIEPLMTCDADTVSLFVANVKQYEDALAGYEKVKFILEYYNPYGNANTDKATKRVSDRLGNMKTVQAANALLNKKHTKDETIKAMESLTLLNAASGVTPEDKELIKNLSSNLNKDWNWCERFFIPTLSELEKWEVLPNEKTAKDAYNDVVYPLIVKKIEEVYNGEKMLPAEMLRLNRVLTILTDATLNYGKSKYRGKVSNPAGFKSWIKELKDNL